MSRKQLSITLGTVLLLLFCTEAESAISLRAGLATPLSEFKDLAKTGWSAEVLADVRSLPVSGLTVVVLFSSVHFGQRDFDFAVDGEKRTQKSQVTLTGGGLGLRITTPTPVLKPFAEFLGRISSVQQDFRDNADKATMESKTKLGYEINAGLRYAVSPGIDLELGGGYSAFSQTKLKHKDTVSEIAPRGWKAFAGVALTIGL
jgi:opacity protein-like surface antigen